MFLPVKGGGPKVLISPYWLYGGTKRVINILGRYQLVLYSEKKHQTDKEDRKGISFS